MARVIDRSIQLDPTMKVFWADARRMIVGCATWYARALEVPGVDFDALNTLPDPSSTAGKALTLEAQTFVAECGGPSGWVDQQLLTAQRDMVFIVTLGRQCVERPTLSGWKKSDGSMSNKLANAVNKEISAYSKLEKQLTSVSSRSK